MKLKLIVLLLVVATAFVQSQGAQTFQHPGVLVSRQQLDFIKAQVNAKVEPFYSEYQWAMASPWGSVNYQIQGPYPGGINQCGSNSNPDNGCKAANMDSSAAYVQALLWYITGNQAYAQNAINIMNAYGRNFKGFAGWTTGIPCPGSASTCSNGPLQAAWDASKWPRAAEIIRYSNAGWADSDIEAFSNMLRDIYQPLIYNGSGSNGNWELSMIEGMMGIAVFNEDAALFQHAQDFWHQRVPAYFYYYPTDGNQPAPFPRNTGSTTWNGQAVFDARVNGISQETCRDFKHTEYGIAATMSAAETAHIQGANLFESEQPRLIAALEFSSYYEYLNSKTVPSYICGGSVTLATGATYVVGYNEYHNRLGQSLPHTAAWINSDVITNNSPTDYSGGPHMMVFEPLTHYADAGSNWAVMTSPLPGSILPGSSVDFAWAPSSGAQQYWIWIGTSTGGMELYNQGQSLNTAATIGALPTDGSTIYVRLFTGANGTWRWNDYTYTAASPSKAVMSSPTAGSTFAGSTVLFSWSPGNSAGQYWIWIGTTPGGMELYNQGQALNTSATIGGLPVDGSNIYVRLFTALSGGWQWNDYTYIAAAPSKAVMISPAAGSTLAGSTVMFSWSPGNSAGQYWIWIGTTPGGMELYNQGQALNTAATIGGFPADGSNIYVRLFTYLNGGWQWNDYTYVAASPM